MVLLQKVHCFLVVQIVVLQIPSYHGLSSFPIDISHYMSRTDNIIRVQQFKFNDILDINS